RCCHPYLLARLRWELWSECGGVFPFVGAVGGQAEIESPTDYQPWRASVPRICCAVAEVDLWAGTEGLWRSLSRFSAKPSGNAGQSWRPRQGLLGMHNKSTRRTNAPRPLRQ